MAETLRQGISGSFTTEELERMMWPIAWSGTMPVQEGKAQEADLHALVNQALEAIEEAGLHSDMEGELVAVIKDGELVEVGEAE